MQSGASEEAPGHRDPEAARRFARLDAALDTLLDLPEADRPAALARLAAGDATFERELHALLAAATFADPRLDVPAFALLQGDPEPAATLPAGTRVGAWAIERLIGRGGMGEVYAAQRVDGAFEQRVAIKLLRIDAAPHHARFDAERQTLARLAHPNIARLFDGGVLPEAAGGRPYMVMELVEGGTPLTRWCDARACTLAQRLDLLLQVCEAVAYAHSHLVVHRDIKPANVLVTPEGRPLLVDFGIARSLRLPNGDGGLVDETTVDATRALPLTLAYAAPEQLTGGAVTTATDVHALGLLAYELLSGQRPWRIDAMPLAAALHSLLEETPPPLSRSGAAPGVDRAALAGDLDAIVAKALRKAPGQRYATVAELGADIERHRRHEAVGARASARWYTFTRMAWRYRTLLGALAAVLVVTAGAAVGLARQAHRADLAAQRATRTGEFLASFFRAADTALPSDKPRGETTARELLDRNARRIETDFADDPALQVELLGLVTDIYVDLDDDEGARTYQRKRMEAATRLYGPAHPIVLAGRMLDVRRSLLHQDYAAALRGLDALDAPLRTAGQDDTALRARWWVDRAEALAATPGRAAEIRDANERAIALLHRLPSRDPPDPTLAEALDNLATIEFAAAHYAAAEDRFEQAIDVQSHLRLRNDPDLATLVGDRGKVRAVLGRFDEAERDFAHAESLFLATTGARYGTYWQVLAEHARMAHARGDVAHAATLFATMRGAIPAGWQSTTDDAIALERYARCLVAEGRAREALPLLRTIEERQQHDPMWVDDLARARVTLGAALAATGVLPAAETALRAAIRDYASEDALQTPDAMAARRELAGVLVDRSLEAAEAAAALRDEAARLLDAVAAAPAPLAAITPEPALARVTQARLALARGDAAGALARLDAAQAAWDAVTGMKDARDEVRLWRLRAQALAATGQREAARALDSRAASAALAQGVMVSAVLGK